MILGKVFFKNSEWELFKIISKRGFYPLNNILILFLSFLKCTASVNKQTDTVLKSRGSINPKHETTKHK
jgi:hypothetical protein